MMMMTEHHLIKKYYYKGNVLVTIEEFINHHPMDDLTKPIQILKEYEPKEEGLDCMISMKGVINGKIIKSIEIFDTTIKKQLIYKKETEYFLDTNQEKYKIETIWDRYGKINSKIKITNTQLIYMI